MRAPSSAAARSSTNPARSQRNQRAQVGLANLFILHTSASLTINENASPDVLLDLNVGGGRVWACARASPGSPHHPDDTGGASELVLGCWHAPLGIPAGLAPALLWHTLVARSRHAAPLPRGPAPRCTHPYLAHPYRAPRPRAVPQDSLDRIAPEGRMYRHDDEGPDDMPAHVKSSLMGASLTVRAAAGEGGEERREGPPARARGAAHGGRSGTAASRASACCP